jgi:hypothetical protein
MPEPHTTAAAAAAVVGKAVAKGGTDKLSDEAGQFLSQVSGGAMREISASIADRVRARRMRAQIRLLEQAQDHLREAGRDPREVKWNVLFPLLEAGSLEEDPDMVERWAALLANAADPEVSEVPPSFPEILKQLSPTEARILDGAFGMLANPGREDAIVHGARIRLAFSLDDTTYALAVENLYRQRLLMPAVTKLSFVDPPDLRFATDTVETVMLTALGEAFVRACQRSQPSVLA